MSRVCRRLPVLLVLAAFLSAQAGLQAHRVGHAGKDAARAASEACPHGKTAAHLCDADHAGDPVPDCDLCASAVSRAVEPVPFSILHVATDFAAVTIVPSGFARRAPGAVLPAPRGPPSA